MTNLDKTTYVKNIASELVTSPDALDATNILSYWPMANSQPRKSQVEVLDWIQTLPSNIKYILCEMPVGGGKSPLALNLSGWFSKTFGSSYILTPQKILQKQYEESFDRKLLHSFYGKINYECKGKKTNCDLGSTIRPKCESCPYQDALKQVKYAPNVVLNYTLALLLFKYLPDESLISKRNLIVFDEAHTLESHLTEFNAISISEFRCKQIGVLFRQYNTLNATIQWIKDAYLPVLTRKITTMSETMQEVIDNCTLTGATPTQAELNEFTTYKEYVKHRDTILEQLLEPPIESVYEQYVLVNEGKTAFKIKELYGKRNFRQFVEPMAERFLFMTSTILDKKSFCEDLGLDPAQAAFISLESEFDVDNRPIVYMPTTKMTYGWDKPEMKKETDKMLNTIIKLATEMHPEDNGVIHAGSFQIAKWLVDNLATKVPHRIMHHNPGTGNLRDAVLRDFQVDDGVPKLLISPSVTEGLDLVGDKGRFAIFAKVPYPFLGDAWVKRRMDLSDSWYKRQALTAMIQGGGRVVRSMDDWGHVYILDSSFSYLMQQCKSMMPKWWSSSITTL